MSNISFSFKAAGVMLALLDKIFQSRIHIEGTENLNDSPTLFVVNHFTRSETFLLPYILYKHRGEMLHSLADSNLFHGKFGEYLRTLGAISTKEPFRNRKIIRELMMGQHNWVIFPEGIMVKNKQVVKNGKLLLDHPDGQGPPHTGAAVMALKAEITKRNYLNAVKREDHERMKFYEERYDFNGPDELCFKDIQIIPVNISYYPIRPDQNFFTQLGKLLVKELPERIEEELKIEGKIFLSATDINVFFGKPISLYQYLDNTLPIANTFLPFLSEKTRSNLIIGLQKTRLTRSFMFEIYNKVAVNIDHVFSSCLRYYNHKEVDERQLKRIIFLVSNYLETLDGRRAHSSLRNDILNLVSDNHHAAYESICELAVKEGAIQRGIDKVFIEPYALRKEQAFHLIRLKNLISVIANEIEPLKKVITRIKRLTSLPKPRIKERVAKQVYRHDMDLYKEDYETYYDKDLSKDESLGKPLFLKSKHTKTGIVLCHGYLASPQEVEPLAQVLNKMGFTVYCVRLKGHGTSPANLKDIVFEDWLESFDRAYAIVRNTCKHVFLGGFSAGGLVALLAAAKKSNDVKGVFTINAALKLQDIRSKFVPSVMVWNDVMDKFNLDQAKMDYIENESEHPEINYSRNYLNGIRQLERLIKTTKTKLPQVVAPALIIQADEDPVVHVDSAEMIESAIQSEPKEKVILHFDRHGILHGEGSEDVFEAVKNFINLTAQASEESPNIN